MNKVGFAFLLFFVFQISVCQFVNKSPQRSAQPLIVIGMLSGSIIADAVGDALCDAGHKVPGHSLQALSVGFLLPLPYILDLKPYTWGWYAASYLLIRVSLFDPFYNITRGLPLEYIGNCSVWDKTLQKFDPPAGMLTGGRVLVFAIGIKIPIDHL